MVQPPTSSGPREGGPFAHPKLAEPVRIVLKTPSGAVGDVWVDCSLDWTVSRLKEHIARVFPGQPQTGEQKLIHSGRLLSEDMSLRDVFGSGAPDLRLPQTVHLVVKPAARRAPLASGPAAPGAPLEQTAADGLPLAAGSGHGDSRRRHPSGSPDARARDGGDQAPDAPLPQPGERGYDEYTRWMRDVEAWRREQVRQGNHDAAASAEAWIRYARPWEALQAQTGAWGDGAAVEAAEEGAEQVDAENAGLPAADPAENELQREGGLTVFLKLALLVYLFSHGASATKLGAMVLVAIAAWLYQTGYLPALSSLLRRVQAADAPREAPNPLPPQEQRNGPGQDAPGPGAPQLQAAAPALLAQEAGAALGEQPALESAPAEGAPTLIHEIEGFLVAFLASLMPGYGLTAAELGVDLPGGRGANGQGEGAAAAGAAAIGAGGGA